MERWRGGCCDGFSPSHVTCDGSLVSTLASPLFPLRNVSRVPRLLCLTRRTLFVFYAAFTLELQINKLLRHVMQLIHQSKQRGPWRKLRGDNCFELSNSTHLSLLATMEMRVLIGWLSRKMAWRVEILTLSAVNKDFKVCQTEWCLPLPNLVLRSVGCVSRFSTVVRNWKLIRRRRGYYICRGGNSR